jgi:hypothetical protein
LVVAVDNAAVLAGDNEDNVEDDVSICPLVLVLRRCCRCFKLLLLLPLLLLLAGNKLLLVSTGLSKLSNVSAILISVGGIATLVTCVAILSYFRTGRKGRKSPKSLHAKPNYFGEKGVFSSHVVTIQVNPDAQGRMISAKKSKQGRSWR